MRTRTGCPSAADVLCIVEVADSSLERDRDEKGPIYARAGVPQYVILNLRERTAEVYGGPDAVAARYARVAIVDAGGSVVFSVGDSERIAVKLAHVLP